VLLIKYQTLPLQVSNASVMLCTIITKQPHRSTCVLYDTVGICSLVTHWTQISWTVGYKKVGVGSRFTPHV